MRQREVDPTKPLPQPYIEMREQLVNEVRSLFREAPCSQYIKEINMVLSYGLIGLSATGPTAAHDAAYYTTRILTFLVQLQEITTDARMEMCQGGMTPQEVYDYI